MLSGEIVYFVSNTDHDPIVLLYVPLRYKSEEVKQQHNEIQQMHLNIFKKCNLDNHVSKEL